MKFHFLAAFTLAVTAILSTAQASERSGGWWNKLPPSERVAYAAGFLDGNTYAAFAVSGAIRKTASRGPIAEEVMRLNIDAIYSEIDTVTPNQLADAVSRIYSNPKNDEIRILEVLYAAARSVRGATEAETSRFLEPRQKR